MTDIPANWDEKVARMGGHFYQTSVWAEFQTALGREVLFESGEDWAALCTLNHGRGGIYYLYSPYGPVISGPAVQAFNELKSVGKKHGVDFVRVEPTGSVTASELKAYGLVQFADVQPKYQLELDIAPSDDELRKNISQSNRNLINQAEARGLSFRISEKLEDVAQFNLIHHATAKAGEFTLHPDDYYQTLVKTLLETGQGRLYFVDHEGQPVAAALCYDWNGTRYYAYAGADPAKNRELKAAIALVWRLIVDAKKNGLDVFNFGGVAPEDEPNHPWAGHSRFKRSIGGETIQTVGTWDIVLKPAMYKVYRLAKRVLPL